MVDRLRTWWQLRTGEEDTPFDGDTPAWLISLVFHLGLLIILTVILYQLPQEDQGHVELVTSVIEEDITVPEEFFFSHLDKVEIGANSFNGVDMADAFAEIEQDITEVDTPPEEEVKPLEVEVGEIVLDSALDVSMAMQADSSLIVQGAAGAGTTGAAGAIDRITQEIIDSLDIRKTLVVWIFDQSVSLSTQRAAIHDRLDRIYEELNVIEATGDRRFAKHDDVPLLSSVIAFGQDVHFMTPKPTDQLAEVKAAVAAIENDESGVENTFTAVYRAAEQYKKYAAARDRRNVMFVVFTDAAGDDGEQMVDQTVGLCRRYVMPVYVVGIPSPFGRKEVAVHWVEPEPELYRDAELWLEETHGPESLKPERIKLMFSGNKRTDEEMDSGFGPFFLTRLCVETSGIYFSVHPNRITHRPVTKAETAHLSAYIKYFFDPNVMRRYRPDYVSVDEYKTLLTQNAAKLALVKAANMPWTTNFERPRMTFAKKDEASLANDLAVAQQNAAKLLNPQSPLILMNQILSQGEKDREKIVRPRWQAGYDLARGRALAAYVRADAYRNMLAEVTRMKFKEEKSDTWVLKPADDTFPNTKLEKAAATARMYLERVVRDHAGTPWAKAAELELADPLGWEWSESYTGVNAPRPAGGGNANPRPRPRDDKKRVIKKKPKRPLPKI